MSNAIVDLCARLGKNPLLVQGAGGNASWKDGEALWIKASGTWLADADKKNIFVAVELLPLRAAIAAGDFQPTPKPIGDGTLRPSIETMLHALMPQKFVVHLHPIEILAHLVRPDFDAAKLNLKSVTVPYRKPGAELAQAVHEALAKTHDANVVFLKNHGAVIGANTVAEIEVHLSQLETALRAGEDDLYEKKPPQLTKRQLGAYAVNSAHKFNALATNVSLLMRLRKDWALYPDHVVFLSDRPHLFESEERLEREIKAGTFTGEFAFVKDRGVFYDQRFTQAKIEQLECYFEVLNRQKLHPELTTLTLEDVAQLLNWEAEKYRQKLKV